MFTTRPHLRARIPGYKCSGNEKGAVEINRKNFTPIGKSHLREILLREDTGAIHYDIDMAEFSLDLLRHGSDRGFRRHVAVYCERLPSGGFDHFHGGLAVDNIDDRYMHAVFRQSLGKCLPDAVRSACNDSDFVFVAFGHEIFPI